jgi:dienelactone hydrolase
MSRFHRTTMVVGFSRMRKRSVVIASLIVVSGGVLCAFGGNGGAATAAKGDRDCPVRTLPLGQDPLSPAVRVALARERPVDKPQVIAAGIATTGVGRGEQVAAMCGRAIASRSVAVAIHRRAYGPGRSASLAEGAMFVARFGTGWRVWYVAH